MRGLEQEPASTSGRAEGNVFAFVDLASFSQMLLQQDMQGRMPNVRHGSDTSRTRSVAKPHLAFPRHGFRVRRQGSISDNVELPEIKDLKDVERKSARKLPGARRLMSHHLKHSLKPKGPGGNDRSRTERLINVVTSLPFIVLGLHTSRQRSSSEGKSFGRAIVATGVAATAYHSAAGGLRVALRKLDHWTISLTAAAMARAVFPNPSRWRRAVGIASLGLAPFQPFAVSAVNFGLTEVEFAKKALSAASPEFRRRYLRHTAVGAVGISCYLMEDVAIGRGCDIVHPLWHCLACYAVAGTNLLIREKETFRHAVAA